MLVPFFLISLLLFCPSAPIDIASIMRRANKIAISYNFRDNCISRKRPFNRKTINYVSKCLSEYDFNYTEDDTLLINLNFDIILNRPDINAFSSLDTLSLFTKKEANIVLVSKEEKHMDAIESSFYYAIKNNWFESFKILHSIYGDKSSAPINNVLRIVLKKGRVASASLWVYELTWNPWEQFTITIKQFHDRLGLVRAVVERSDYYAYGTRISQPYSGASAYPQLSANRWRFSGKEEQDAVASSPTLDFGARQYDPFTARWLSPDPLAEKYYGHSPYLFCAGSPINFVDPRGEIWDNPQSVRMLEHYTNLRLQELSSQKEVLQKRIESGLFSNDVVDSFLSSIIELDKQTEYLRQSLSDIEYLANDLTNTYVLDAVLKPDHNVRIGPNNRVFIETSSDAISLHEISHVRQALNAGRLTFNSEGKLLNPGKNLNEMIKNEVEAYRIQYSFDPLSFPGVLYGSPGIDGINRKSVIEIKFNGQYAYPFLNYQH